MRQRNLAACIVLAGLATTTGNAGQNAYECTVINRFTLENDATLSASPKPVSRGERFAVDRDDGRVVGGSTFSNKTASTVQVVNRGSKDAAFKSYTVFRNLREFQTLTIHEPVKGRKKPFMFVDSWSQVVTGFCE
jgi:hypothetical protein